MPAECFCGTFLGVAPTGCYPAPCSMELGLSSCRRSARGHLVCLDAQAYESTELIVKGTRRLYQSFSTRRQATKLTLYEGGFRLVQRDHQVVSERSGFDHIFCEIRAEVEVLHRVIDPPPGEGGPK